MGIANAGRFEIGGDLAVHRLGFGAMRLVGRNIWGPPDDPENALAVLRRAIALGVDFIDTAEAYGPEINERQIAEALAPYPAGLAIATKCGIERFRPDPDGLIDARMKGSRAEIRASIEGSLSRLGVERIDLYQLHRIDPVVPVEESIAALAELRSEGKLRHIGVSEFTVADLDRARAVAPIATVQNRYNVRDRKYDDVVDYCAANGIGFMPWFPLGSGRLCAPDGPLAPVAARHGATPSQIALAWLLARSPVMLPIPGTASIAHLEQNVAAADVTLTAGDLADLEAVAEPA